MRSTTSAKRQLVNDGRLNVLSPVQERAYRASHTPKNPPGDAEGLNAILNGRDKNPIEHRATPLRERWAIPQHLCLRRGVFVFLARQQVLWDTATAILELHFGEKKLGMDEHLTEAYTKRLTIWIAAWKKRTNLPQEAIGRYTIHFDFGEKAHFSELSKDKISRTLRSRPTTRIDGTSNLLLMLAVLYMAEVIHTEQEIQQFLETYHIPMPKGMTWEAVWHAIEAGTARGRQLTSLPPPPPSRNVGHLSWGLLVVAVASLTCVTLGSRLAAQSMPFTPISSRSGIVQYLNGWCAAMPLRFSDSGGLSAYLYLSSEAQVGDFSQHRYYIYFTNNYLSEDALHLDGVDKDTQQWRFRLDDGWVRQHPNWNTAAAWRVEYQC